jgi:hypothetical protein
MDGSNWNNALSGGFSGGLDTGLSVAYGNGKWVAVGGGGTANNLANTNHILISSDGKNWNNISVGDNNSQFNNQNYPKGPPFKRDSIPNDIYLATQVATDSNNNWLVSIHGYGNTIASVNNGLTWGGNFGGALAENAAFVAFYLPGPYWGFGGTGGSPQFGIRRTTDNNLLNSAIWTIIPPGTINTPTEAATGIYTASVANGRVYASGKNMRSGIPSTIGGNNSGMIYSTDVQTWNSISGTNNIPTPTYGNRVKAMYSVTYDTTCNVYYAGIAANSNAIYGGSVQQYSTILRSTDGINWYPSMTATSATFGQGLSASIGGYATFGMMHRPPIFIPGTPVDHNISTTTLATNSVTVKSISTNALYVSSINNKKTPYWEFGFNTIASPNISSVVSLTSTDVPTNVNIIITAAGTTSASAMYYTASYSSSSTFTVAKYTLNTGSPNTGTGNFYWVALWNK